MLKKLCMAGLLCASLALAQGGYGGGRSKQGAGDLDPTTGRGGGARPSNRFDYIAQVLNLNKDQKRDVHTILEDGAKEAAPIRDQMDKSRVVVGEAIVSKKGEDELKQLAKSSSDLDAQLSELEVQAFFKTVGTLDETQKKNMQGLGRALFLMNGMYHIKNWTEE
ncbi:MAG TPA: hypothetical protein VHW09_21765 [Bryobacteraceae bacterium]|jgi:hypothetical protein|nr:hypothetical protein [Bryobacteraceae bacterium]